MSISRRSFLKLAGLTTVAVAGTALFTGCSVASHLKIELGADVMAEYKDKPLPDDLPEQVKSLLDRFGVTDQESAVNKMVDLTNAALLFLPLFGVSKFKPTEAREKIYTALDKYGPSVGLDAESIAEVKKTLDQLEMETDTNGYIVATGEGYSTITITFHKAAATQSLSL